MNDGQGNAGVWLRGVALMAGVGLAVGAANLADPWMAQMLPGFDVGARHMLAIVAAVFGGWALWIGGRWAWARVRPGG